MGSGRENIFLGEITSKKKLVEGPLSDSICVAKFHFSFVPVVMNIMQGSLK